MTTVLRRTARAALIVASALPFAFVAPGVLDAHHASPTPAPHHTQPRK